MDSLIVHKASMPKIRVGSNSDGGYIIVDGLTYDAMLSGGISTNIDFEVEFLNKHNVPCYAYDGTVSSLPRLHPNITFIKKNISPINSERTSNLHDKIDAYRNIFFKMDIESYEFKWLETLSTEQLNNMAQIVIEIHFPFIPYPRDITHFDSDIPVERKMGVLKKLAETHTLVHLHANNCCGTSVYEGVTVPNIFECTYVRNDLHTPSGLNTIPIPGSLDRPNLPRYPEINLNWPPFVHSP